MEGLNGWREGIGEGRGGLRGGIGDVEEMG